MKKTDDYEWLQIEGSGSDTKYYVHELDEFMTATQIAELKECIVGRRVLKQRIERILSREGGVKTLWGAMTTPKNQLPRGISDGCQPKKRGRQLPFHSDEFYELTEMMKLLKPGSLHRKVR